MNIFDKRPLSLILCIALGGFFIFATGNLLTRVILIAVALLPMIISCISKVEPKKQTICQVASVTLIVSFLLSFLYFDGWFKAYERYDGEVTVVGRVEDSTLSNSYTTRLLIKVESIDGKNARGYKLYAYAKRADTKEIISGARIEFTATLTGFSDDSRNYNISRGINAYASGVDNMRVLEYTDGGISGRISRLREYLSRYTMSLTSTESGAILSALLLGERDYLPDQLRLDFKRIGISHILALSGMHLAILSLGIGKLLSLMKIKKKSRLIIISAFIVLYMALTGFSVSVVRAGIMLIIGSALFLLEQTKDSLTSLSVAVFVICLIHPYAVFDLSLQLSALATFGLIAFSEYNLLENPMKNKGRFSKILFNGIFTSVFAISATLIISTGSFGGFSILSPIATLIFSVIVEIIMYLGCITLLIGWLLPIGEAVVALCRIVTILAGWLSSFEFTYVTLGFTLGAVLVTIYSLLFYFFVIAKVKDRKTAFVAITIIFCLVITVPTVSAVRRDGEERISYYSAVKADEILVRSNNEVCLINSSQYSKSAAYDSLDFLEKEQISYLDFYFLTHYSWSIDEDLDVLLSSMPVEKIFLPAPRNEDEKAILKVVEKCTENYRTTLYTLADSEMLKVGEDRISLTYSEPYGNTSVNSLRIESDGVIYSYISSGLVGLDGKINISSVLADSDVIIFGKHGKKYKEAVYISDYRENIGAIIIESENLFIDEEVKEQYDNTCRFYNSNGNVVILK